MQHPDLLLQYTDETIATYYKENGPHGTFSLDFGVWWSTWPFGPILLASIQDII